MKSKYILFVLDLTGEQQRLMLSIGKKDVRGLGIEFKKKYTEKAFKFIGDDLLNAFPNFIEYDNIISVEGDEVAMQYFDRSIMDDVEVVLPLQWVLDYIAEKGLINSYWYDNEYPDESTVTFTYDLDLDEEREDTIHANNFIEVMDECDARHMLYAFHMEEIVNELKTKQRQSEAA